MMYWFWRMSILFVISNLIIFASAFLTTDTGSCSGGFGGQNVRISRIVGGNITDIRKYPFVINLFVNNRSACAGSLISLEWVLTAAHCLSERNLQYMKLLAGQSDVHAIKRSPCSQLLPVKLAIRHEGFQTKPVANDIGLIKADGKFRMTNYVRPIRMATPAENMDKDVAELKDKCIVVGWGQTVQRNSSSNITFPYSPVKLLREVELPLINLDQCRKLMPRLKLTPSQMCTLYAKGGKDACVGDSGGPLFWNRGRSDKDYVLQGIISFGVGCARPRVPGIFTRVDKYETWIKDVTTNTTNRNIVYSKESSKASKHVSRCVTILIIKYILLYESKI